MRVILTDVALKEAAMLERGEPMSTLIASETLWMETDWNGRTIGDIFIYRTSPTQQAAYRAALHNAKTGEVVPYEKGAYHGSVPNGQVKNYRFKNGEPTAVSDAQQKATPANAKAQSQGEGAAR